jgi:hypothetical protein
MSWSISATGKPAVVKAALVKQFEVTKVSTAGIPHEQKSVELVEQLVNDQLDFLAQVTKPQAVTVSAGGSVWYSKTGDDITGSSQVQLKVEPIYDFVE